MVNTIKEIRIEEIESFLQCTLLAENQTSVLASSVFLVRLFAPLALHLPFVGNVVEKMIIGAAHSIYLPFQAVKATIVFAFSANPPRLSFKTH